LLARRLGVALAEIAMGGPYDETGFGLDIDLTAYGLRLAADELLFSESHGRAIVTCQPERATAALALAQELGVPAHRVGTVAQRGGAVRLRLRDAIVEHPVEGLRQVYFSSVSRRMGDDGQMCGIIGVTGVPDAARVAYLGLYSLQHRGQESGGMVAVDGEGVARSHRGMDSCRTSSTSES